MTKFQDLSGKKFGRLLVIKRAEDHICPNGKHKVKWLCKCECGNEVIVLANHLRSGHTNSCGCFKREKLSTHGLRNTKLYNIWDNMKRRCYNPNHKEYKNYGARGISICKKWKEDFQNFYDWAMSSGYDENAKYGECTIDRIDVNGNYDPSNCRWVDMKIQDRNKRNNRIITINGETHCLIEWCEILNLNHNTVRSRIHRGWSPEKALEI